MMNYFHVLTFHSIGKLLYENQVIHPLLAVFVSTLVNIQTGISSGNLLFKLLGWNLFTVWWMPDGIKTFSTHFINGKRVDHYNLYLGLKAQSMRVSCFLQHFQHQQHESLSSLTSRSSTLLDLIVTSFHSYRVNASNHLSIEIHKTFFFSFIWTPHHTVEWVGTRTQQTGILQWPHLGSDHSTQYSAKAAHMNLNLCQWPEALSWARGGW